MTTDKASVRPTLVSVWCTVEVACPKCGRSMQRAGRAPIIGGKIGEPELCVSINPDQPCNECVKEANREAAKKKRPPRLRLTEETP